MQTHAFREDLAWQTLQQGIIKEDESMLLSTPATLSSCRTVAACAAMPQGAPTHCGWSSAARHGAVQTLLHP